ncbi:ribonuclease H-like domain-containing protein, partial [Tanacetum coccineum]
MLKHEFSEFMVSKSEGLHKGYDRFQKILSQLNQMQAKPDNEDCNMKFLKALPPSWSQVAITLKTKGGLDYISFDDLYNKLRTLEIDVKGGSSYDSRGTFAPTHSVFISAASTNSKMSYADSQNQSPSITFTTASSSADILLLQAMRKALPDGKIAIGTKWILKNKRDARGMVVRNKARLVAQGHRQEEGIDYDEVFALVARIEAIRLFLTFASYMGKLKKK